MGLAQARPNYRGVADDAREARYRRTHACTCMYVHVRACTYLQIRALIRLVAGATNRERRLFRSALAQVRLLFESGVYSRAAFIRERRLFESGVYSVIYGIVY